MTDHDQSDVRPFRPVHAHDPPAFSRPVPRGEWIACRYADVQAILADNRFEVVSGGPAGPVGTIGWLRASVSRFVNGAEHQQRRRRLVEELSLLDPTELRTAAHERCTRWRSCPAPANGST